MIIRSVTYAGTVAQPDGPIPGDHPQVAFAGRSNVGKSSLINTLLGRTRKKIAHVSATPGKTQAINFFLVNETFFLVDLPGFGFAKVPKPMKDAWQRLMEGFLARPDGPKAVVHLLDIRRGPTPDDVTMLHYLEQLGMPTLVVLTKVDKLTRQARIRQIREIEEKLGLDQDQVVASSAVTGEGRDEILGALSAVLEPSEAPSPEAAEAEAPSAGEDAPSAGEGAGP
jgi:GTP-binding protein